MKLSNKQAREIKNLVAEFFTNSIPPTVIADGEPYRWHHCDINERQALDNLIAAIRKSRLF